MAQIIKTDCALCVNCCGVDAYVENGRLVKIEGTPEHWLNEGALCPKGERLVEWVYSPDRLKSPMKKVNGRFQTISWDLALDEIAAKLKELKEEYGGHTLALWTGSVGVENIELSAFMQRFRGAYGSPNFFNAEGICFRSRILARQITFGRYPVEEPEKANCIILWGHNPDASYFMTAARIRKMAKKGLRLITIDPRRIPLAKEGIYIQPRPGTDCAIALAMMHVIIREDLWDKEFVRKWTMGFDRLVEHVQEFTPEKAEIISGVPASEIRNIARIFATSKGACIMEGVGSLQQVTNGLQTCRAFAILETITGNIDVPGGWATTPMLPLADLRLPLDEKPLGAIEYPVFYKFGKRPAPYGSPSLMTDAILREKPYPIKAFFSAGSNPAVTFPDTKRFMEAMRNVDLFVNIDPFMTETSQMADYALPACTFLEETGIGGYPLGLSHGVPYIMMRKKVIERLHESRQIWWIFSELGRKLGYAEYFPWNTDEEVLENFLSNSIISYQKLTDNPGGCYFAEKTYKVYEKKGFSTESGKAEIFSEGLQRFGFPGLPTYIEPHQSPVVNPELAKKYPEILLSGARQLEYHAAQMRNLSRLRTARPEADAEIHPVTAKKYDIVHGEMIGVETPRGMIKIKADVTQDIMEGVISVPYGWATANVNILLDSTLRDPISGYIELRGIACRVVKLA
jgi:formate dehydrogenase (coenzyme F420) alpha subunit